MSEIFACVFPFFFLCSPSFPIKMHATDAKTQKIEPGPNFFWRTKISEAVCKRDWQREFLDSVCNDLKSETFACVGPFFSYFSSFPIKMHVMDAKTQKIEPDFFYDARKFRRQCVNVIDTTWGRIYFLMCENFGLSVQWPLVAIVSFWSTWFVYICHI